MLSATDGYVLDTTTVRDFIAGDFSALLPPREDIQRVRTTSAEASISIHLLTDER